MTLSLKAIYQVIKFGSTANISKPNKIKTKSQVFQTILGATSSKQASLQTQATKKAKNSQYIL